VILPPSPEAAHADRKEILDQRLKTGVLNWSPNVLVLQRRTYSGDANATTIHSYPGKARGFLWQVSAISVVLIAQM
jgi:hypothetical protein